MDSRSGLEPAAHAGHRPHGEGSRVRDVRGAGPRADGGSRRGDGLVLLQRVPARLAERKGLSPWLTSSSIVSAPTSSKSGGASTRAASAPATTATSASASPSNRVLTTPKSVSKGYMTPDMMVVVDLDGKKISGDREASSELLMHLEVYRQRPDAQGGRPRASAARDRLCRGRRGARPGRARRSDLHARQHPDRRLRHAVDAGAARGRAPVHQGTRRAAACQSRCADRWSRCLWRVLQDGDRRALREDQPRRAAARRRAADLAGGSHPAPESARHVRHRVAGTDLPGRRGRVGSAGDGRDLPGGSLARRAGSASRPRSVERARIRTPHRERQRAP